jgi:hypothetical protein
MFDQRVFSALKEELESAKQRHEEAKEQFWRVGGSPRELPRRFTAGVPEPDGSLILRKAVAAEIEARTAHLEALKRINEYLLHGTIPEDVRQKMAAAGHPSDKAPGVH